MGLVNRTGYKFNNLNSLNKIIVIMILCFIAPFLINTLYFLFQIKEFSIIGFFDISQDLSTLIYKPWSIITYAFFHADFWHLLGNMIILHLSGTVVLDLFGKETFIKVFVLGILFGSLTYLISYNVFPVFNNVNSSMIGASAGVMAVFIFLASYSPDFKSQIFFINVKIYYLAILLVVFDIIQIPAGNSGGHLAHLGGAFIGYYYNKSINKGKDFGFWIITVYDYLFKKNRIKNSYKKRNFRKKNISVKQKEIDLILDKISKSGYDSLSKSEKETLFKAGEK